MVKRKSRRFFDFNGRDGDKDQEFLTTTRKLSMPPEHAPSPKPATTRATVESVLAMVHAYKEYWGKNYESIHNQPKLDALELYDVTEEEEKLLWEHEVMRLVGVVADLKKRLEFKYDEIFPEPDTEASYEGLSKLADQLLVNLHICRYDNEVVLSQFADKQSEWNTYTTSQRILEDRLDNSGNARVLSREETRSRTFLERYCALVDYATATAARLAVSAADLEAWQIRTLAGLAKYSAKLKMLARDSEEYAMRALDHGKQVAAEKQIMSKFGISHLGLDSEMVKNPGNQTGGGGGGGGGVGTSATLGIAAGQSLIPGVQGGWNYGSRDPRRMKELEAFLQSEDPLKDNYFSDMSLINSWTSSVLLQMIQAMKATSISGLAVDSFDICSVVYRAGTMDSPLPIFVHQDRDGEVSGSSSPSFIKQSYVAFTLVQQAVDELKENLCQTPTPSTDTSEGKPKGRLSGTSIVTRFDEPQPSDIIKSVRPLEIPLHSMSQILIVMVPLLCTMPTVIWQMQSSLRRLGEMFSIEVEEEIESRCPNFTAMAALRTQAFKAQSSSYLDGADFKSLSMSLVVNQDRQAATFKAAPTTNVWDNLPTERREQRISEVHQRRQALVQEGREWVMEESAVRVKCPRYVYTVIAICVFLVVGGLMVGIFMGERQTGPLAGVDPFNITTFAWLLAGFITLIAKSIRVVEWPWRDFLLGRVTCRSLSELRAVTQANEQDLLIYLLSKESETVLVTRGPYNRAFKRRADGSNSGFSIDYRPEVGTLLASGLIFVKVSTMDGTALVCLDFRRGGKDDNRTMIRHNDTTGDVELMCRYPPRAGDKVQDVELGGSRRGGYVMIRWRKILGVYNASERKVR